MKLTKEDYSRFPKERLIELIIEKDEEIFNLTEQLMLRGSVQPTFPWISNGGDIMAVPCYAPNGICTNPCMDCINCPKRGLGGGIITRPNTTGDGMNVKVLNEFQVVAEEENKKDDA